MNNFGLFGEAALIKPHHISAPNAWLGHVPFLAWLLTVLQPNRYVELGTHTGNSYLAACQAIVENKLSTQCSAIDTWVGDEHAGQYSDNIYHTLRNYHVERYAHFSQLMRMTFDDGLQYFSDKSIDLLHIDGLHTYEAVKHDFDTWLCKVSDRGVILFHDICVRERNFGVWKLWDELKPLYPNIEFQHNHGLGVLFVGPSVPDMLKQLLNMWADSGSLKIQNLFASHGDRVLYQYDVWELKQGVEDREVMIASLNDGLIERDEIIRARNQDIVERDAIIHARNIDIIKRDDVIHAQNQDIAERDEVIRARNNDIVERDAVIRAHNEA